MNSGQGPGCLANERVPVTLGIFFLARQRDRRMIDPMIQLFEAGARQIPGIGRFERDYGWGWKRITRSQVWRRLGYAPKFLIYKICNLLVFRYEIAYIDKNLIQ